MNSFMGIEEEKDKVLGNLTRALTILESCKELAELIPEVRINFVYALKNASSINDVAAIPGRITAFQNKIIISGYPRFGASSHMARAIIEIMKYDPSIRAGINLKYTEELKEFLKQFCEKEGLIFSWIDRSKEPKEIQLKEGLSIPWKIKEAIKNAGNKVPNVFYESAALGKEPLFVVLGKNAIEVANLVVKIAKEWKKRF